MCPSLGEASQLFPYYPQNSSPQKSVHETRMMLSTGLGSAMAFLTSMSFAVASVVHGQSTIPARMAAVPICHTQQQPGMSRTQRRGILPT